MVQKELVSRLVAQEYAVYLVNDYIRFKDVVKTVEDPIVFINIDEALSIKKWKNYISDLMGGDRPVPVGVLTYNEDPELAREFLMDLMIPCGFIKLKLGLEQSFEIILKTLEVNEARGRRKYLRVNCSGVKNTGFNVLQGERMLEGKVVDISSIGMSFIFNDNVRLAKNTLIKGVQVRLKGRLCRVSGPIVGCSSTPDGLLYVMLFEKTTSYKQKECIYSFIYEVLQDEITEVMKRPQLVTTLV
ncbi:MAG: PilZ domain-containing protein [Spirochaetales bacterium]|nr:PilZ domain-containing protein [Spirochaetales bacterium]